MTADIITQVAFITGRLLHAGTSQPVVGRIRITAEEGPIIDKVLEDGTFAISGWLELLFPNLDTQDYQLHLHVRVDSPQFRQGFIELPLPPVTIPMGSNFDPDPPILPDPHIDLGTILLPADPVNIQGQVVDAAAGQFVFAVQAEIYFSHPIDTQVQVVQTSEVEFQRTLGTASSAGDNQIVLDDRSDLVVDHVLQIDSGANLEYGIIENPTPAQPNAVILRNNLAHPHFAGRPVQPVNVLPLLLPVETQLKEQINPQDRVVLLKSDTGFTAREYYRNRWKSCY